MSHAKLLRNKSESLALTQASSSSSSSWRLLPKTAFFLLFRFHHWARRCMNAMFFFYDIGTWHTMKHLCRERIFRFTSKEKRTIHKSLIQGFGADELFSCSGSRSRELWSFSYSSGPTLKLHSSSSRHSLLL